MKKNKKNNLAFISLAVVVLTLIGVGITHLSDQNRNKEVEKRAELLVEALEAEASAAKLE